MVIVKKSGLQQKSWKVERIGEQLSIGVHSNGPLVIGLRLLFAIVPCHESAPLWTSLNEAQHEIKAYQSHTESDDDTSLGKTNKPGTWQLGQKEHTAESQSFRSNSFLLNCCINYHTVLQSGSSSVVVEAFSASATSFRAWHQAQPRLPESHDRQQASRSSVYTWSIPENGFTTTCCASKQSKTPTCQNFDSSKLKPEAPVPRNEMGTQIVHVEGMNPGSAHEMMAPTHM